MDYTDSMEVVFCPTCSQVVSQNYLYCPHCGGRLRVDRDLSAILSDSLAPLERQEGARRIRRLDELLCRLTLLEECLDIIIEDEKPHPEGLFQAKK